MESPRQEFRKLEKRTAKTWAGLLVGLVGLTLLIIETRQLLSCIILVVLFVLSVLSIIYLLLPGGWKWKGFLKKVTTVLTEAQIENVTWLLGLGALGISLTQIGYRIPGVICGFSGIVIFYVCAYRQAGRKKLKETKEMGSKGRKNVKKPKQKKKKNEREG